MRLQGATEKAFCAAFFFLPISKPLLFVSLLLAFSLFIAGGGLAAALRSWRTLPWVAPAAVLAALPLLSLAIHGDPRQGLASLNLSYYWLFAFMTFLAASQMSIIPWLRALVCGIFVGLCLFWLSAIGLPVPGAASSAMENLILQSQFLALGIVLPALLYQQEASRVLRPLYLAAMALFFIGLLSGSGRIGMLAVIVLLPLIFGRMVERQDRGRMALACVITVLVIVMSPNVQKRLGALIMNLQLLEENVTETSLGWRLEMWRTAWDVFREHLWVGSGAAGFKLAWHSVPRTGEGLGFVEPHNAFLFFATSYGLIGLAALVWLYAALLRTGWRHLQSVEGSVIFAFAVILVLGSFTNTMFMGAASRAWIMLFIGLQGALLRTLPQSPAPASVSPVPR